MSNPLSVLVIEGWWNAPRGGNDDNFTYSFDVFIFFIRGSLAMTLYPCFA